jgi:hypothetical protein
MMPVRRLPPQPNLLRDRKMAALPPRTQMAVHFT